MLYIAIVNFRQEYDVREERRRELEFLEKVSLQVVLQIGFFCSFGLISPFFLQGGNPLDFRFDHVESVSLQSTSLTDQIAEQNVIR